MFMNSIRKQTHQCALHKLKIVYKTYSRNIQESFVFKKINFLASHAVVPDKTFPFMYQLLM